MTDLASLIERVERCTRTDNGLDIAIEVALFEPDTRHSAVRPNDAGTKLVYTRRDRGTDTYWAPDHTLNPDRRAKAVALLKAKQATP